MPELTTDIIILGSGFGGSLLALLLARAGKSVAMVDRSRHPKFAIGESSTPLADRTLAQMADEYGISELRPLCHWGSWKRERPQLLCGKKRGFTYFDQTTGEDLTTEGFGARRLLVSASADDEHSDTHWLRSDVDQFVFQRAIASGVLTFEKCQYALRQEDGQWVVEGNADADRKPIRIRAPFLIDATGSSNGVLKFLNIPDQTHLLKTNSRSIFAHFESAATCEQLLHTRSIDVGMFPYHCDDAAVHQVLPDGWMWQLRFDDDTLSAGFMIDERLEADPILLTFATPQEEWDWRIARSQFLSRQFENATIVRPESGLQSTKRIQRLAGQGAGYNWAAIANTVGFIDPLHSTGIAHTLFSVSRLADILLSGCDLAVHAKRLQDYSDKLIAEIRFVDELVEGCYEAIPSFPLWCQWGMLYFAAATSMEQTPAGKIGDVSFLRANDVAFRTLMREARERLSLARLSATPINNFSAWLKFAIGPWNQVGLFDDSCNNLYSRTAAPADAW
jgi:tetracycline 7-halogenase / FADH2 O2-dependent halogenase